MFQIHSKGQTENRLDLFGDASLQPGCVNFVYLKNLLCEYTNCKNEEIP
jgi:hypothetical protein